VNLKQLQKHWNAFGEEDPFWAVLTHEDKRGNRWRVDEFFATGVAEIAAVMADIESLGLVVPRGRALDFGCGVGRLTQALVPHFREVWGIDIAPSMIELAQKLCPHTCRFILNTSERLEEIPDDSIDLIYSSIVLQHIEPRYAKDYLAEFLRVLTPSGLLVFQLPSELRPSEVSLARRLVPGPLRSLWRAFRSARQFPRMEGHGIPRDELVAVLSSLGGEVLAVVDDESAGPAWVSFRYFVRRAQNSPRRTTS
jgi:SAM-dependent methyltransferase